MGDESRDLANVYFSIRRKVFLVVSLAKRGRLAQGEVGEPVEIAEAEFESEIGTILIECLDSFQTNVYSQEAARRLSNAEYRIFRKHHVGVSVERLSSGDIVLRPLHHLQGGYVANRGEQIVIRKQDIPDKVPAALREAFALAT